VRGDIGVLHSIMTVSQFVSRFVVRNATHGSVVQLRQRGTTSLLVGCACARVCARECV
jgi:hypothetical protein